MPRAQPKLANIQCKRIQFRPGDRVLVECYHELDEFQRKKLRKAVQKWAGEDVEVLIYNSKRMNVTVEQYG